MFKKINPWIKVGMGLVIGAEIGHQVMVIVRTVAERLADKLLEESKNSKNA